MTTPNFLIIGAQKAGTSSLYHYLRQHPEIYLSPVKETHYFSYLGSDITFKDPGFFPGKFKYVKTQESYEALFSAQTKETAVGEISPSYIYVPGTATRIYEQYPQMKLVAILRNPADRAFSNYIHNRSLPKGSQEPLQNFVDALNAENVRKQAGWSSSWHYKSKGFYYEQLKTYYDYFGSDKILIILFEDLKMQPTKTVAQICSFLNVDSSYRFKLSNAFNSSGLPRNNFIRNVRSILQKVAPLIKYLIPRQIFQILRCFFLKKPAINEEVRSQLLADYRDDILKLETLTNKSFRHWLQ